jgi:hypothetical protein
MDSKSNQHHYNRLHVLGTIPHRDSRWLSGHPEMYVDGNRIHPVRRTAMTATKAIAAFVGGLITWLFGAGVVPIPTTWQIWLGLIGAICTAIITYAAPANRPKTIEGTVVNPK